MRYERNEEEHHHGKEEPLKLPNIQFYLAAVVVAAGEEFYDSPELSQNLTSSVSRSVRGGFLYLPIDLLVAIFV